MIEIASFEQESELKLKSFFVTLASNYTLTLYLLFSIVDYTFYPEFFFKFLIVRLVVITILLASKKIIFKYEKASYQFVQSIIIIPIAACAISIQYMFYEISDTNSSYWAGLAIIIAGISIGFRFTWKFYFALLGLILLPISAIVFFINLQNPNPKSFLSIIFLISISAVSSVGRWFYESLSNIEFNNRKKLADEIESRNKIIEEKTQESIRLNTLSKQFSPQIIKSIRNGEISITGKVHRSEICAIFVDIKDSTIKFSILDRDDLQKIISMYMEDVMGIFLKYDITIDKFLGDGVMGFSNDPVHQSDYIERVIMAAIEIKTKLNLKKEAYSRFWGSDFEIRIGISSGFASVGFYGSDLHVKSYTAIGRVINLASRVNGVAPANGIAISGEIISKIRDSNPQFLREYNIEDLGSQTLKGFENDKVRIFRIDKFQEEKLSEENEICPHGHGPLVLDQDQKGIYIMKCRYCDYILGEKAELKAS